MDVCLLHDICLCRSLLSRFTDSREYTACWESTHRVRLPVHSWFRDYVGTDRLDHHRGIVSIEISLQRYGIGHSFKL